MWNAVPPFARNHLYPTVQSQLCRPFVSLSMWFLQVLGFCIFFSSATTPPTIFHNSVFCSSLILGHLHPVKGQAVKMVHMTDVLDILKNPQLFHLRDQEENPETNPIRNAGTLKASHQTFRHFQYLSVTGPHLAVSQIRELCRQWLQPETHTKEQMMEQLVLEQFLNTLPEAVQIWVRSKQPKNSKEAGALVAALIQACGKKGERERKQLAISIY